MRVLIQTGLEHTAGEQSTTTRELTHEEAMRFFDTIRWTDIRFLSLGPDNIRVLTKEQVIQIPISQPEVKRILFRSLMSTEAEPSIGDRLKTA